MHISKYTSDQNVPANLQLHIDNSLNIGSFVAVLDNTNDTHYHLAKIMAVDEHTTTVHYYATYGKRLRSAMWKPLYQLPHTNQVVMQKPDTINKNHVQWTGTLDNTARGCDLVILANIGMTPTMKITSRTRTVLRSMNKYSHHILTTTWMKG